MTVSQKQLEANRRNALKGGVKTAEGKAVVRYNALKHGLLAKEVVITVGEGAESPEAFDALLGDLQRELNPVGTLEEMLVEKIAAAYWRLRRAHRYEVGLIRKQLDTATDDYYNEKDWRDDKLHKPEEKIEQQIGSEKGMIREWKKDRRQLRRMQKEGLSLEETYGDEWEGNWDWLYDRVSYLLEEKGREDEELSPQELREFLHQAGWDDARIWQTLIRICDERIEHHKGRIVALEKERGKNRLKLQVVKRLGNIPPKEDLERLLRYEGAIERQFYKALNQLERLQRARQGDRIPAPVAIDLDVNTE